VIAREAFQFAADLAFRDPPFIRGGGLAPGDVPVFTFHSLEPESFDRRMRFLANAGYRTLSVAEYLAVVRGETPAPPRAVLLTIDDGRATTWTVGYPVLRQYGLRAIAFLVTSVVHDSAEVGATCAFTGDCPSRTDGGGTTEPGADRERFGDLPFLTWAEVERMQDVIEVESHTHTHARIPVARRKAFVLHERQRRGYEQFDVPFLRIDGELRRGADLPAGHPLPAFASRLSSARRVDVEGIETAEARRLSILHELTEPIETLRRRLGRRATALCYPWHVAARDVPSLVREAGYTLAFGGKSVRGTPVSRPNCDLLRIPRVGEDWVERLPGEGRRSFATVFVEKIQRRRTAP
jgi:hypothetical protein